MNGRFIFIALFWGISAFGSTQTAYFPDVWITSKKLLQSLSDGVSNTKNIEDEAHRRTQANVHFLSNKKTYVEILRNQRVQIRKLRAKIFETQTFIQSNSQPTTEELESELYELLNRPTEFEFSETQETHRIQVSEPDPKVLEQSPTRVNFDKPSGWTVPTESQGSTASSSDGMPLCPISYVVMTDPVVASDGHTYNRPAIERWFAENIRQNVTIRSPMTNLVLTNLDLIPNHALRQLLQSVSMRPKVSVATQTPERMLLPSQQNHIVDSPPTMRSIQTVPMIGLQPEHSLAVRNVPTLEWLLTPETFNNVSFAQAIDYCRSQGNLWRLPDVWELFSLYQQRQALTDMNYVLNDFVWSRTRFDRDSNAVWFLSFQDGTVWHSMLQFEHRVICVRSMNTVQPTRRAVLEENSPESIEFDWEYGLDD